MILRLSREHQIPDHSNCSLFNRDHRATARASVDLRSADPCHHILWHFHSYSNMHILNEWNGKNEGKLCLQDPVLFISWPVILNECQSAQQELKTTINYGYIVVVGSIRCIPPQHTYYVKNDPWIVSSKKSICHYEDHICSKFQWMRWST